MRNFSTYKVIYVDDLGNISETLNATLVDGKIVFNTTHLSTYGIVAYNETNPQTSDGILSNVILACLSLLNLILCAVVSNNKRFN